MSTRSLSRRQFTRLALSGIVLSAAGACAVSGATTGDVVPETEVAGVPSPAATAAGRILRNENAPGFYVRYYRAFPAVDVATWGLTVEGMVGNPVKLSLAEVLAVPRVSQVSRMKCVECWSAPAEWEGLHMRSLVALVKPAVDATWVHLHCADGYYESARLDDVMQERVLLAHHMNGEILPDKYGAPLRLMNPALYGYKSAKAIVRMVFSDKELVGYWPTVGAYSTDGMILPGRDHPLDLGGVRNISGGEIAYPDGIESGTGEGL